MNVAGFPACNEVAKVWRPSLVQEMVTIVKDASDAELPVRASGVRAFLAPTYPTMY